LGNKKINNNMAKTKTAVAAKSNKNVPFNSVVLAWVLSFLAIPTVMTLVPAMFDTNNGQFNYAGETLWYAVWQNIWQSVIFLFFATLLVSYTISTILNIDSFSQASLKKINRTAFIIATVLNVAIILGLLIFGYLLPVLGYPM